MAVIGIVVLKFRSLFLGNIYKMKIKNSSSLLPISYFLLPKKGFTLIELILVIAMLAIIGGMSVPFFQSFQVTSDLATYSDTVARTLRRAQAQARAGQNTDSWGVFFDTASNDITLFYGDDYDARDVTFDQTESFASSFTLSTDFFDEIYFTIFSGDPSTTGSVTLTSQNNDIKTISINSLGIISIQ